jgi:RNA polymerase sigma-70 factor (ECF subfamily)
MDSTLQEAPVQRERDLRLDDAWLAHRAHLINVAFRILADIGAAEDAVQEAFSRLLRADRAAIEDERGWLVVVTSRICLDQIRSARARRDRPQPSEQVEREAPVSSVDPADRVTLDDEVRIALHVVLQRLSPAERVVFVMHDVFRIPFDAIAETVGRPAATCRQLASRARQRIAADVDGRGVGVGVGRSDERLATDAFIAACASGDLAGLLAILDPEVTGDGDFGPDLPVPPVAIGASTVARRTLAFLGHGATLVSHPSSASAVLAYVGHDLLASIEITVVGGVIVELHADGRPTTLDRIATDLAEAASTLPPD